MEFNKSRLLLICIIAGLVWVSKDYLASKKHLLVGQAEDQASTTQYSKPSSLKKYATD